MSLYIDKNTILIKNKDSSTKLDLSASSTFYQINYYNSEARSTRDSFNFPINFRAAGIGNDLEFNYITITDCNGSIGKELIGRRMPFNFPILIDYEQNNITGYYEDYEVLFPDCTYRNLVGANSATGVVANITKPTTKFVNYTLERYVLTRS